MKEQIKEILDNEELDSSSKTEEIAKIIGENTVVKSKYNDKVTELRKKESDLSSLNEQYETLKTSTMSDAEKSQKAEETIKAREKEFLLKSNRLDAERAFIKAGFSEEDYKDMINDYVSEDAEMTNKRITNVIDLFKKTKEVTTTQVKEDILKSTPKPAVQDPTKVSTTITKDEFSKMSAWDRSELYKTNKTLFEELSK